MADHSGERILILGAARQGLALALLHTGLHMLRQRGMDTARLGTSSENIAMQGVAQAAGFQIESSTLWFSKNFKG